MQIKTPLRPTPEATVGTHHFTEGDTVRINGMAWEILDLTCEPVTRAATCDEVVGWKAAYVVKCDGFALRIVRESDIEAEG